MKNNFKIDESRFKELISLYKTTSDDFKLKYQLVSLCRDLVYYCVNICRRYDIINLSSASYDFLKKTLQANQDDTKRK